MTDVYVGEKVWQMSMNNGERKKKLHFLILNLIFSF